MSRRRNSALPVSALTMVAGLIAMASPAAAMAGTGGGTGRFDYVRSAASGVICTHLDATYNDAGDWTGVVTNNEGTVSYSGALKVKFEYSTYANPLGTFSDPNCLFPAPPSITSLTMWSPAKVNGVSVDCAFGAGSQNLFVRDSLNWTATVVGSGGASGCAVYTGNTGTKQATRLVIRGTITTCNAAPPDWCNSGPDRFTAEPA